MKSRLLLWPLGIAGLLTIAAPTLFPYPRPATDASFASPAPARIGGRRGNQESLGPRRPRRRAR